MNVGDARMDRVNVSGADIIAIQFCICSAKKSANVEPDRADITETEIDSGFYKAAKGIIHFQFSERERFFKKGGVVQAHIGIGLPCASCRAKAGSVANARAFVRKIALCVVSMIETCLGSGGIACLVRRDLRIFNLFQGLCRFAVSQQTKGAF